MDALTFTTLKNEFGYNKIIPKEYEVAILTALSHYPELKNIRIRFVLRNRYPVPYGAIPSFKSLLMSPDKRQYSISILEKAKPPEEKILMKNLSFNAQVGVMGHEIAHVVQYHSCGKFQLLKFLTMYLQPDLKQKIERTADLYTISHGLGKQLLEHAIYIRSIPGYTEGRKAINKYYLKPEEIINYLKDL